MMSDQNPNQQRISTNRGHIFPGGLLWHFTSPGTLLSIFQNGLRATHSSCLSDRLDCALSNRVLELFYEIARFKKEQGGDSVSPDVDRDVKKYIGDGLFLNAFIVCFSIAPDFELAWERYTPKGGFAIGFKEEYVLGLRNGCPLVMPDSPNAGKKDSKTCTNILAQCCEYKHPLPTLIQIQKLHDEIQAAFANPVLRNDVKAMEGFETSKGAEIEKLTEELLFMKRKQFAWEREFRVAFLFENGAPGYAVQSDSQSEKTFISLQQPEELKSCIEKIIVSPNGTPQKNLKEARQMAQTFDLDPDGVELFQDEIGQFDQLGELMK